METKKIIPSFESISQSIIMGKEPDFIVFAYDCEKIYEEVFKRTSYIGKSRTNEQGQHLLDLIALTKDDCSVFHPFLHDAAARIFVSFEAFTKNSTGNYLVHECSGISAYDSECIYSINDRVIRAGKIWQLKTETATGKFDITQWVVLPDFFYTDGKVIFVAEKKEWWNENFFHPIENLIFEALVHYIIYRWFMIVFPSEAAFYKSEFERYNGDIGKQLNAINGRKIQQRYRPLG